MPLGFNKQLLIQWGKYFCPVPTNDWITLSTPITFSNNVYAYTCGGSDWNIFYAIYANKYRVEVWHSRNASTYISYILIGR